MNVKKQSPATPLSACAATKLNLTQSDDKRVNASLKCDSRKYSYTIHQVQGICAGGKQEDLGAFNLAGCCITAVNSAFEESL